MLTIVPPPRTEVVLFTLTPVLPPEILLEALFPPAITVLLLSVLPLSEDTLEVCTSESLFTEELPTALLLTLLLSEVLRLPDVLLIP